MKPESEEAESEIPRGLTPKAFIVGTLMCLGIGVGAVYGSLVLRSSRMAMNFNTPAAIFAFFVLVGGVNLLLGLIRRDVALNRSELLVVYIMVVVATCLPTMGFTEYLLSDISGAFYYATSENNWAELVHPYLPGWLVVRDPEAVWAFYEGLPEGRSIPWRVWIGPLFYWCSFFIVLSFTMICMMVILRKQWVEKERLIYPLAHLPLEMVQDDPDGSLVKPFLKNPVMWAGFAIPFIIGSVKALHSYYHFIPPINLSTTIPLFRRTIALRLQPSFPLIGFTYLVNLDIALGFWFFHLLGVLERGVFTMLGFESTETLSAYVATSADLAHQGMGAMIVLVIVGLWVARRHLRDVVRKAFRGDEDVKDAEEILPYRTAFFGMIGGLLFIGFWMWRSGLPLLAVPVFLFGTFILYLALTRVLVEGAVGSMAPPMLNLDFVTASIGTTVLGPSGIAALTLTYVWNEMRSFVMASCANGLRLAERVGGRRKLLFWAMMLAVVVSLVGSVCAVLYFPYRYGGINLHRHFFHNHAHYTFDDMTRNMRAFHGPSLRGWLFTGAGGAVMGLLMWMRYRLLWWPLHPLGFAIGCAGGWLVGVVWFSAFIAWLLKAAILKYGGPKLYRQARPFFLGLILGQPVVAGVWLIIDSFTGMTDNVIAVF